VDVTLDEVVVTGDARGGDTWEPSATITVHDVEVPVQIGETVQIDCTTVDWIRIVVTSQETSGVIDQQVSRRSSIQGHDVLEQSPYAISRTLTAEGQADGGGDLVFEFRFSLEAGEGGG